MIMKASIILFSICIIVLSTHLSHQDRRDPEMLMVGGFTNDISVAD